MRRLRIAQIAPLWEEVPPKQYGGTERIVSYLTERLVEKGHDVVLFASGDSRTSAELESIWPTALRKTPPPVDPTALALAHLGRVFQYDGEFDVIHNHMGIQAFPLLAEAESAVLTTIHDGFTQGNVSYFNRFKALPFVSISNAQRAPLPKINYLSTVHHGIPMEAFPFSAGPETTRPYLAFLGRMSPEKAPHIAIKAAVETGWRLKMAAKIASHEVSYFKNFVEPFVDGDQIQYLGELGHQAKCELLAGAAAMLFPIQWKEPFGLVMIESLACGTPVIAYRNGSVPEVIRHGDSGFVVSSREEMVRALREIDKLSRQACREDAEGRFSDGVMADNYVRVYEDAIADSQSESAGESGAAA
ncbi:MAG TPA: glycosyltransferase family 4 protein [Blastocatellia bacterium]|nr:glycosyltransferase family 4 protein [Blastocatellia bacterium]